MIKYFILLLTLFFLYSSPTQAQVDSTTAKNNLIDSVCTCISKIDSSQLHSAMETWQTCMNCFGKYVDLFKTYVISTGTDTTKLAETGPGIANWISVEIYNNCPYFQTLVKRYTH